MASRDRQRVSYCILWGACVGIRCVFDHFSCWTPPLLTYAQVRKFTHKQLNNLNSFKLLPLTNMRCYCTYKCVYSKAGMTLKDAMMLIKRRRPEAEPIPAFLDLLERFEQTCNTSSGHKRKTKKQLQVVGPTIGPSVGPRTIGPSIGPSWVVSEKDAITTTSATTLSKKKKRKRMVGPFRGPSLEYTLSPNEVQIGPTLPRTKPAPQASNDTSDPNIGPQLPSDPSTTSNIGPQLPSDPSTTLLPLIDSTTTNANAAADSLNGVMSISNKTEVGPQLPEWKSSKGRARRRREALHRVS